MKKFLICFFIIINSLSLLGQEDADLTKNALGCGFGRYTLFYLKYERLLYHNAWTRTVANVKLGGVMVQGTPIYLNAFQSYYYQNIFQVNLIPGAAQLFGYKNYYLELGIEPSFNFNKEVTYTSLNGIIGFRYYYVKLGQSWLYFECGYNPRLYASHKNKNEYKISQFYLGFGRCF
jgi:hypothetical protein